MRIAPGLAGPRAFASSFALSFVASVAALLAAARANAVTDDGPPRFHIADRVAVHVSERADAEGCMVHLHGNEQPARAALVTLVAKSCTNALVIDDAITGAPWAVERIPVPTTTGECSVNPNRIFTVTGFNTRIELDCDNDPVARRELRRFVDDVLVPALARCRGGARALPVVAFHNNSNMTAGDMDAQKVDTRDPKKHDILFVTHADDFAQLSSLKRWTVALQNTPPADDGSLSVFFQRDRYVNVEADIAPQNAQNNVEMGAWGLRSVGAYVCGPGDWRVRPARH